MFSRDKIISSTTIVFYLIEKHEHILFQTCDVLNEDACAMLNGHVLLLFQLINLSLGPSSINLFEQQVNLVYNILVM